MALPSLARWLPWALGWCLLARVPTPRRPSAGDWPAPAIVVPARDEEHRLARLLASLESQSLRPAEIVVVDDCSRDRTADVARLGGARVVAAGEPPAGWLGKPWALTAGVLATESPVVVLLDADVELGAPEALASLVDELAATTGLVSVQPWHAVERPVERLAAVCNLVSMMGVDAFGATSRWSTPTGAFGPCLVTRRADYERVGGHAARPGAVLDDASLARAYLRAGMQVRVLGGGALVRFRMYPGGWRELREGFTKNLAPGAGGVRALTLVLIACWVTGALRSAGRLAAVLVRPGAGAPARLLRATGYAAWSAQLWWMLRRVGRFGPAVAVAYPLPTVAFVWLCARSGAAAARGHAPWKGREVRLRPRPA